METRRCRFSHLFVCPLWSLSTWIPNAQKVNGIFFLSFSGAWLIIQNWPEMTPNDPCVLLKQKKEHPKTHSWLSLLIVHFNEGWIIQGALVDIIAQCADAVNIFMEAWSSACVYGCVFWGWGGFCEEGQRFQRCLHASVCCCLSH